MVPPARDPVGGTWEEMLVVVKRTVGLPAPMMPQIVTSVPTTSRSWRISDAMRKGVFINAVQ
jgi:hypothetical protein